MRAYDCVFNTNCNEYTIQILNVTLYSQVIHKNTQYIFCFAFGFEGYYKKWYILLCYRQPRMEEIFERSRRGPEDQTWDQKLHHFHVFKQKDQSNLYYMVYVVCSSRCKFDLLDVHVKSGWSTESITSSAFGDSNSSTTCKQNRQKIH